MTETSLASSSARQGMSRAQAIGECAATVAGASANTGRNLLWFQATCTALAAIALVIAVLPTLPILSQADDQMRYYIGGYAAAAEAGLAPALQRDVNDAVASVEGFERRRLLAALTAYSTIWIPQTAVLDAIWRLYPGPMELHNWVVFSSTIAGLAWMIVLIGMMVRLFRGHSVGWLLAVLVVSVFLHQHTRPLDFAPRGLSTFATGLAIALVMTGRRTDAAILSLLALGALCHNYQQLLNIAAATTLLLLLRPRRVVDITVPALIFVGVSFAIMFLTRTSAVQTPSDMLGGSIGGDWESNWAKNEAALIQVIRYMAPLAALLVWSLAGGGRAVLMAAAVAASVVAAAVLSDPGPYLGDYVNRLGGAWNGVILALLLQRDWLRAAAAAPVSRRRIAMAACLLVLSGMVVRMDARYLFFDRVDAFRNRLATGLDYPVGPTESAGLSLIPDRVHRVTPR